MSRIDAMRDEWDKMGRDQDYEDRERDESEECPHGVLYCEPCTACFPPRWEES